MNFQINPCTNCAIVISTVFKGRRTDISDTKFGALVNIWSKII